MDRQRERSNSFTPTQRWNAPSLGPIPSNHKGILIVTDNNIEERTNIYCHSVVAGIDFGNTKVDDEVVNALKIPIQIQSGNGVGRVYNVGSTSEITCVRTQPQVTANESENKMSQEAFEALKHQQKVDREHDIRVAEMRRAEQAEKNRLLELQLELELVQARLQLEARNAHDTGGSPPPVRSREQEVPRSANQSFE